MATVIHYSIGSVKNSEERNLEWAGEYTASLTKRGYVVRRYAVRDRDGRPVVVFGIGRTGTFLTNVIAVSPQS
jgi:hypothetical protein